MVDILRLLIVFSALRVSAIWGGNRLLFALIFLLGSMPIWTNLVSLTFCRVISRVSLPQSILPCIQHTALPDRTSGVVTKISTTTNMVSPCASLSYVMFSSTNIHFSNVAVCLLNTHNHLVHAKNTHSTPTYAYLPHSHGFLGACFDMDQDFHTMERVSKIEDPEIHSGMLTA